MTAPKVIWAYDDGLWLEAWDAPPSGAEYIRADAPELVALVSTVRAEIEARNLYLATAPDRGGNHGTKGQRRLALEAAQSATVLALAAYEGMGK